MPLGCHQSSALTWRDKTLEVKGSPNIFSPGFVYSQWNFLSKLKGRKKIPHKCNLGSSLNSVASNSINIHAHELSPLLQGWTWLQALTCLTKHSSIWVYFLEAWQRILGVLKRSVSVGIPPGSFTVNCIPTGWSTHRKTWADEIKTFN